MSSAARPATGRARVHLVCGALGAGKSTLARRLATRHGAVRFATDEWMQALFAPDLPAQLDWAWAVERAGRCERSIASVAERVLAAGCDVVLELGLMRVADRTRVVGGWRSGGHPVLVYWVQADVGVRRARVEQRDAQRGATFSFAVTPAMFDAVERLFEPPTAEELASSEAIEDESPGDAPPAA